MFGTVVQALDRAHARVGAAERELLALIVRAAREEAWADEGARDLAHWLGMRYGISHWKARRWIDAAQALEELPLVSGALERGELGLDTVVELCRFATAETEAKLIGWAKEVSVGAVRHRGDLEIRRTREETVEVERCRRLEW